MQVIQYADADLELVDMFDAGFEVESRDPEAHFSALQLFATSLGLCAFSALAAYGSHLELDPSDIRIRLRWVYGDRPNRIAGIEMSIQWPSLPESRMEAARRAAEQCALHHTLAHPPEVTTRMAH